MALPAPCLHPTLIRRGSLPFAAILQQPPLIQGVRPQPPRPIPLQKATLLLGTTGEQKEPQSPWFPHRKQAHEPLPTQDLQRSKTEKRGKGHKKKRTTKAGSPPSATRSNKDSQCTFHTQPQGRCRGDLAARQRKRGASATPNTLKLRQPWQPALHRKKEIGTGTAPLLPKKWHRNQGPTFC